MLDDRLWKAAIEAGARVPDVLMGHRISPWVEIEAPKAWKQNATFRWKPPSGKIFDKFQVQAKYLKGEVVPVKATTWNKSNPDFVWADAAIDRVVSVTVTIKGMPITRSTKVNVLRPESSGTAKAKGQPAMEQNALRGKMGLLDPPDGNGGMVFTASVDQPAKFTPGAWNLVQLTYSNRIFRPRRRSNRDPVALRWALDNTYPYMDWIDKYWLNRGELDPAWAANGDERVDVDYPDITPMPKLDTGAEIHDQFMTWIMYKPDGGEWVPLRNVMWKLDCTESRPGTGNPWQFGGGTVATVPANGEFHIANQYLTWTLVAYNSPDDAVPQPGTT